MKYIPAVIPPGFAATRVGVLWTAANIVIDEAEVDDAIAEAARRAFVYAADVHLEAQCRAIEIARSRVPMAPLDPSSSSSTWQTWQAAIAETWPILADAAGALESRADVSAGLLPGWWAL